MKRTTLVTVPTTISGRTLTVTYRVSVVVDAGGRNTDPGSVSPAWGYAEAVPVRVSSEPEFDFAIPPDGDGAPVGDTGSTGDGGR